MHLAPNIATPIFKNMAEKQLIVAVEGTAAMGPHWQAVVSDYLDKIIRYLPLPKILFSKCSLVLIFHDIYWVLDGLSIINKFWRENNLVYCLFGYLEIVKNA